MAGNASFGDIVRILSSRANLDILLLLSLGDSHPREISAALGRDETDVSRRLRRMEEAGLVKGYWRRLAGRNVRVYSLVASRLSISIRHGRVEVSLEGGPRGEARLRSTLGVPRYPRPLGRERELEALRSSGGGVVSVWGPPGVGKTHLVSYHVSEAHGDQPIAWIRGSGSVSGRAIMWRAASALALAGAGEALEAAASGDPDLLLSALEGTGLVVVVDDYHELPRDAWGVVEAMAGILGGGVYIVSRQRVRGLAGLRALSVELGPLELGAFKALLEEALGEGVGEGVAREVWRILRGIPGLVGVAARLAREYGLLGAARRAWSMYYEGLLDDPALGPGRALAEVLSAASGWVRLRHACRAAGLGYAECRGVLAGLKARGLVEESLGDVRLRGFYASTPLGDPAEAAERLAGVLAGSNVDSERVWAAELAARHCLHRVAKPLARARLVRASSYILCCPGRYAEAMRILASCPGSGAARGYYEAEEAIAGTTAGILGPGEASEILEGVLTRYPLDPAARTRLYSVLANYHAMEGDLDRAGKAFRRAVELLRNLRGREKLYVEASIYSAGTLVYYELGMPGEARRAAEREAELYARLGDETNYYTALIHIAELERLSLNYRTALEAIKRIEEELEGTLAYAALKALLLIVKVHSLLALGKHREALASLEEIPPASRPHTAELHSLRAAAHHLAGRRGEALRDAEEALNLGACTAPEEACTIAMIVKALATGREPPRGSVPKHLKPLVDRLLEGP